MDYLIICGTALLASGLTFFSGFGLGTLLLPAFAAFFSLELAVAMTALVHFSNNLFKIGLVGRYLDFGVLLKFGITSLLFALLGAFLLEYTVQLTPLYTYNLLGSSHSILPIKLLIAVLMCIFALLELIPRLAQLSFDSKYLPLGGALSGFFGGLSGHQGALRSMFLLRLKLSKERFIATGVAIACLIDVVRLAVYTPQLLSHNIQGKAPLLIAAIVSATIGAYAGSKLLKKITLKSLQLLVAIALILFACALGLGLI